MAMYIFIMICWTFSYLKLFIELKKDCKNMNKLKVGDTILCNDENDMINVSQELSKQGIYTDWFYISENSDRKYMLTVVEVE